MLYLAPNEDTPTKTTERPKGSALHVYRRLLGYAWPYKSKLFISLLFSIFITASFASMLFAVKEVVDLTYYKPVIDEATGTLQHDDPQDRIGNGIRHFNTAVENFVHWIPGEFAEHYIHAPQGLESWFQDLVTSMRAEPTAALTVTCLLLICFSLVIGIARFIQEYYAGAIGANISTDLAQSMYDNLMAQSVGFFETRTTGDVLSRFTNDIFMVNSGLASVLVKLMREPLKALGFLGWALWIDPLLTLVGICGLPPVAIILIKIGQKMRKSVRRSLEKIASLASVVNETVQGISIVKVFTMERYEVNRVHVEIGRLRKFLFQMVRLNAITGPSTEFILIISVSAFVLVAGGRVEAGLLTEGDLISLFVALAMLLDPVRKLSAVNNMVQTSVASAERVFEFIDAQSTIQDAEDAAVLPAMAQGIQFEHVNFSYEPGTPVLHDINIDVKVGEMIALVGLSGSGKSTLVKLIPRFYDVDSGAVRIDGVDMRSLTLQSLRDQISLVTQDTKLFAESIRSNISAGNDSYSQAQIEAAAQAANAAEFIEKLPRGYDTILDEGGVTLSGGQKQRLAIARAFIKDPAILILDEATSALDADSDRLIQDALENFLEGRTAFVIAHRLSTVQRADRILVLDQGRIVEEGTHGQLMAMNGVYTRLYNTQFGSQEGRP